MNINDISGDLQVLYCDMKIPVLSTGDIITGPANYCCLLPIFLSEGKDFEARENKDVFYPSSTSP